MLEQLDRYFALTGGDGRHPTIVAESTDRRSAAPAAA
jgi:hypothetical protein